MTIQTLSFKTERDLLLIDILSALLVAVVAFFPNSPARIILGLPFILFFPGYMLICALFPRNSDLDSIERLALSLGFSIAVTALIGFALNYTAFEIRLYPVIVSLFSFILLMSALGMYMRRRITSRDAFAPLAQISSSEYLEKIKRELVKFNSENRIPIILAIIAFSFITIALVLIKNSPATGYEASTYTATPYLVWFFLISSVVCGIYITVYEVYQRDTYRSKLWALGFLLIFLSIIAIRYLAQIRGYFFYGSEDIATHLGHILGILSSGHFNEQNIYPATHIVCAQMAQVLHIDPKVIVNFFPFVFYILSVVFIYLFARTLLPRKGQTIFATIVLLIMGYGGCSIAPNHAANLILPLVFYLFAKSYGPTEGKSKFPFTVLFVIMLILYPLFHPMPAIILLILLLTIGLPGKVSVPQSKSLAVSKRQSYKFSSAAFLVLITWFITWVSSFYVWESAIQNLNFFLTEGGPSTLTRLETRALHVEGFGYSAWEYFFKVYSGTLFCIILALVAFPILIKRMKEDINLRNLFAFYAPLIASALVVLVGYFSNLSGLLRIMVIIPLLCSLFIGFLLYDLLECKFKRKRWCKACLCVIIVLLITLNINGVLMTHHPPYSLHPNEQVTRTELKGMDWFFHSKNVNTLWLSQLINARRYADMLLTEEERAGRNDIINIPLPYHFGYPKSNSLGNLFEKDHYMALKMADRVLYAEVWTKLAELRFLPRDFKRLENDASVDKLYSNGGFDAYFIQARRVP